MGVLNSLDHRIASAVTILLPIACIIHILHTRRDVWWIFLVLFFPIIGPLVYVFMEVYPLFGRTHRSAFSPRVHRPAKAPRPTHRRLAKLEEELSFSPTFANRLALGDAYLEAEQLERAIATYQACLNGNYARHATVLYHLALAFFRSGDNTRAEQTLRRLADADSQDFEGHRLILLARVQHRTGRLDEALETFAQLQRFPGEEARCRRAVLLAEMGRHQEAHAIFQDIVTKAKRSPGLYRSSQKEWIQMARKELRALKKRAPVQ